jgi:hypothetical protein
MASSSSRPHWFSAKKIYQARLAALAVAAVVTIASGAVAVDADRGAVHFGPSNGPAPLGETIAGTFRDGLYSQVVLSEEIMLYRVYGGSAAALGSYWTQTPPTGPLQARRDFALNPIWGNTAEHVSTIKVPAGTTIYEGYAARRGELVGGGSQVYIPKANRDWLDGSYTPVVLSEEITLYRVYGGNAARLGSYWTRTPPTGPLQARKDLALDPIWGNTAKRVSTIKVPAGTTIYESCAARQGELVGDGSQVYIPKVNRDWLVSW